MKIATLLRLSIGLLLGVSAIGCEGSKTPTVVESNVPTEQQMQDYEAEMNQNPVMTE